jgi:hypothetical protein
LQVEDKGRLEVESFLQELYPHKCLATMIHSFKECCDVGRPLLVFDSSKLNVRLIVC